MSELFFYIGRYFWAAIHLKPVQVWSRLVWAAKRRFRRIPGLANIAFEATRIRDSRGIPPRATVRFSFLSESREYPIDAVEWDSARSVGCGNGVPVKLWRYNLQYFDWLNHGEIAFDPETATYLILDWIARCADDAAEAWEPYPVSRRLNSWLKWLRGKPGAASDKRFMALIRRSVIVQVRRLEIDLETHIQANHLLMNRMALVAATAWLIETSDADAKPLVCRLEGQADALRREIGEQVLPDGGHYELSPMYHGEMLESIDWTADAVKTVIAGSAAGERLPACGSLLARCDEVLPKMRAWLDLLTHPDGRIALFHDSALSTGSHIDTKEYNTGITTWLPDSKYLVARQPGGWYLAVCAHAPSPPHQPGHAQCDIGSFELSVQGRRLVVDTGTGSYQNPEIRRFCRSTGAHNVPMIETFEQSDMWGDFRVGRRAEVTQTGSSENEIRLMWRDMSENVFSRLIRWDASSVHVRDARQGGCAEGRFVSLLHLAPGMRPLSGDGTRPNDSGPVSGRILIEADGRPFCTISTGCRVAIEPSLYYPEFGPGRENFRLRFMAGTEGVIEYEITC